MVSIVSIGSCYILSAYLGIGGVNYRPDLDFLLVKDVNSSGQAIVESIDPVTHKSHIDLATILDVNRLKISSDIYSKVSCVGRYIESRHK